MKYFLLLLLCTASCSTYAQDNTTINIGKTDSVYSTILHEQRKIWIYTPGITSGDHDTSKRYPVLYLLDGDGHFASVVGMIQQLSQVNGNSIVPEMIVVAIPNTDRTRDLTPTHVDSDPPMMDSGFSKTTGGGENFVAFIEKELMPHIDSVYRTQPYRMLVGHSFGGLTVMNVLTNHSKMFNAYIAIDPSMWYDREKFLQATEKKLAAQKYNGTKLYLGIANTMPSGMTLDKLKKDTSADTRHIRSIFELQRFIKANPQNGLRFASNYYPNDDHSSVPMITEYDGLRFIFDFYRLKLEQSDFTDSSTAFADKLKKHYEVVSKEFGYTVHAPELMTNQFGYIALGQKQYTKAGALFKLNISSYPNSANVYDSYADYFSAIADTAHAIEWYEKALSINENPDTRRKLGMLKGEKVFTLSVDDMKRYIGDYVLDINGATITVSIVNNALSASVPGEGDFELVPVAPGKFSVKNLQGYEVSFDASNGVITGFTSEQPNGTYTAKKKQ